MSLHSQFDKLMGHLNSEENEMALELRQEIKLAHHKVCAYDALVSCGVDNWEGYDDAIGLLGGEE